MKKGETVVKIIKTGPYECAVVGKITAVKGNAVTFGEDEHLRYDKTTGREIDPAPGFAAAGISLRLVRMDGV